MENEEEKLEKEKWSARNNLKERVRKRRRGQIREKVTGNLKVNKVLTQIRRQREKMKRNRTREEEERKKQDERKKETEKYREKEKE